MTQDLGIGIVVLQGAKECQERLLLSRSSRVAGFAVLVQTAFVADANGVGVVATDMCTYHFLGTALMELAILCDVIVVADGLKTAAFVAGLEFFDGEVLRDFRCGAMNNNQVNSSHD